MNKINKIKKFHEKIIEIILKNKLNNIEKMHLLETAD